MADFNRLPIGVIHRCDRTNRTSECIPCNSLPNGIHPSEGQRGFDLLSLMLQDQFGFAYFSFFLLSVSLLLYFWLLLSGPL